MWCKYSDLRLPKCKETNTNMACIKSQWPSLLQECSLYFHPKSQPFIRQVVHQTTLPLERCLYALQYATITSLDDCDCGDLSTVPYEGIDFQDPSGTLQDVPSFQMFVVHYLRNPKHFFFRIGKSAQHKGGRCQGAQGHSDLTLPLNYVFSMLCSAGIIQFMYILLTACTSFLDCGLHFNGLDIQCPE